MWECLWIRQVLFVVVLFLLKYDPYISRISKKGKKSKTMKKNDNERFIVSVKVGPKGQITIPKEAREMFDIKVGDTLMVMGDKDRGIALLKADMFYQMMEANKKWKRC